MYTTLNKQTSFFVALSLTLVLFSTCKKDDGECNTANVPTIEWQKTIDGNDTTIINSVQQTTDGGYILVKAKHKGPNSGNYWIVKLNSNADIEWEKSYGGSDYDKAQSIQQTIDGGYIVAGLTFSNDGDVTNNNGGVDAWILKLTVNGDIEWQKNYGGSNSDYLTSIKQTADGGYIAVGQSYSTDGDLFNNQGNFDAWAIKIAANGNIEWSKSFGGSSVDYLNDIQQTANGDYLTVGVTQSTDGDITINKDGIYYWLIKLQANGNIEWQKGYGDSRFDNAKCIQKTNDGNYIIVGSNSSNNGIIITINEISDILFIKIDSLGTVLHQTSVNAGNNEAANNALQTHDNNFLVAGYTQNTNSNIYNIFVVALDTNCNLLWQQQIPQEDDSISAKTIFETPDCGYMLFGNELLENGLTNDIIIKLK
jgi:hypothetical protein